MTLLIVDDNIKFRSRLASIVTELDGIQLVGQSGDVQEAIGTIEQTKPDAVILDIHMPGGSGLDVMRTAKMTKPGPVIIILTVCPASEYKDKCIAMGADYFFEKSDDLTKMMSALAKLSRKFKVHG